MVDKSYPPTHQYNTFLMKPKGSLKDRVEIIESEFPLFFSGDRFLDIACNWGYFSFKNKTNFNEIIGIDNNPACVADCQKRNKQAHISFQNISFRDFSSPIGFDKIFVGNVAHHLFLDCGDWSWLAKLHALSENEVLIEGAISTQCKDIFDLVPSELHVKFNLFQTEMAKYFKLKKIVATTSYTPDRYLMLYEKILKPKHQLKTLPVKKNISCQDFRVYKTVNHYIAKIFVRNPHNLQLWTGLIRVRLACNSPTTNGMDGEVYIGTRMVGWIEKKLPGDSFRYFENEEEIWNKVCNHNIFLAKNGYVDIDYATINFNKKTGLLYDKSCVFPINKLNTESIEVIKVLYEQSYRKRGSFLNNIVEAIKSKDSKKVEDAFRKSKTNE